MADTQPISPQNAAPAGYGGADAGAAPVAGQGAYQQAGSTGAQAGGQPAQGGGAGALSDANTALSPGYSVNLFDCFNDPTGCLITCCCPCLPLTATKAALDERQCTLCDAFCGVSAYQNRQTIRAKYKKGFSPASDFVAFCCCPICAIVQDVQELAKVSGKPSDFVNLMRA